MKNINFKKYIFIGVVAVFAVSSVFLTIESVAVGSEVSNLEEKKEALLRDQRQLQGSLAGGASHGMLEEKSRELGFVKPAELMYLTVQEPVASLP